MQKNSWSDPFEYISLGKLLKQYNIALNKRLGQHFLSDWNTLRRIVELATVSEEDLVLEIGCGAGTLTTTIAATGASVIGIEIDRSLAPLLTDRFMDHTNVNIIYDDALNLDFQKLLNQQKNFSQLKIIANVPYYITSALVEKFLLEIPFAETIGVLVQQEAGEHFTAKSGKSFGPLTVLCQTYGEVREVFKVKPSLFLPPPQVISSVIQMTSRKLPVVLDYLAFYDFLQSCFKQRRKTLINNLHHAFPQFEKSSLEKILQELGLELAIRPDRVDVKTFCNLFKYFC